MQTHRMLIFRILSILNYSLKLRNTKSKHELKDLLTKFREFKFVTAMVLEFERIKCDDATKYSNFYLS